MPVQRVLLYGRSLFIAGLQASLETIPGLKLQDVEAQEDHLQEWMSAWQPDVLIFELSSLAQAPSLAVLKDYPNILLIGMDLESNQLLVLSGYQQHAFSANDLVQVIHQEKLVS